jgi:hypothetical protein
MYLLIKGCNGFGNMMSILSFIYNLVLNNPHLILVIDWTHKEWKLGFDRYFKLNKIKYMKYEDFKQLDLNSFIIFPEEFNKENILKPLSEIFPNLDKDNLYSNLFNPVLNKIHNKKYNVLVFSYNWVGYEHIKLLWNDIILEEILYEEIKEKIISLKKYNAIHIRHTDNKNKSSEWFINYLKQNLDKNIYVATDNEIILNIAKQIHPKIFNYTHFYEKSKPLHLQELSEYDKDNINKDTITDMFILINSIELKITPIKTIPYMTTYSLMALSLK